MTINSNYELLKYMQVNNVDIDKAKKAVKDEEENQENQEGNTPTCS